MTLDVSVRARFTAPGAEPFTVDAELQVETGDTLVVLGPSGSGKTLLLECIGGHHPHEGHVVSHGRDCTDLPPEARGFGFVFQDYALFPHMTARENVAFGTDYHDEAGEPDEQLAALGVTDLADRYPDTLSGGEQQRVALARSLVIDPDVLLLDEPLSALDAPTRRSLRGDLARVLDGVTACYVTHDRTTARALGDRVAVMRDGQVVQVGTPDDVFERPKTAFVARFVGANVLPGDLVGGEAPRVAIRPEDVRLGSGDGEFSGTVTQAAREEAATRVAVDVDGTVVEALVRESPAVGSTVGVDLPASELVALNRDDAR
ncbi:ABC transporter ATP-binding protein [Haloarchaeobius sp. TZWWS8]|uniref:ABC transporter ATP-binding protein n=1 Tax=Haloarchaeobius sp. TZWWS8 TaxID=3446121 RepID=UPI003EBAB483